jgi:hypothetical protein
MSNLLRSLSGRLRTLVDIAFYSSLATLQFKLWLSVFDNLFRNGRLETEDVFVMFLLLLTLCPHSAPPSLQEVISLCTQ